MSAHYLTLVMLFMTAWSRVSFLGYPNGGNITVTCQTSLTFPVGNYFAQTCIANNCVAPVTFTWSPDLTQYGIALNTISPVTIVIDPTPAAIAMGQLTTTVTANDNDGPSASGPVTFIFSCPLSLANPIPNQEITEGTFWSLNVASFFNNPAQHTITWAVSGFPSNSAITINSQGVLSGIPGVMDATATQPIDVYVTATDATTGMSVRSNTFRVRVTPLPGISFPSSLGPIPSQVATETVVYTFNAARHFSNPSNFRVTWSINAGVLTGFYIDSLTGVISITPGAAELLATRNQPVSITVSGVDERGNLATSNAFQFSVVPVPITLLPIPSPLPTINCGSFCCGWNVADYVNNPSSNPATYTLVGGLPAGSQIRLSQNGTFSGLASSVDVRASPIVLQVQVNNGQTSGPITMPPLSFSVAGLAAPTLSGIASPSRTVKVGTFFTLETRPFFTLPAGSVANWSMTGPSSLSIDFTGKVTGILQDADYAADPTLTFVVTVSNRGVCGGGTVSHTFQFTIDPNWQGPSCQVRTQSSITVCEKSVFPYHNFSALCRDPKGAALNYSIVGLPNNTGLTFDATTGTLRGTVSTTAADSPSVSVQVCAMNVYNLQDCSAPFQINFQRAKRPPVADPPIPSPVTAILGQRFVGYFNFHFYEPDWQPLIYSVAGLPVGSGLGIGPITGIFSGTPNQADFRASPLVLSVFASNEQNVDPRGGACAAQGQGGRARADLIIIIDRPPSLPVCLPIANDNSVAQIGMFWARDVSTSFQPGEGAVKLEYALRSLPRGSGLSIDPRSGVVSGVLTQQDLQSSPLTIVVAVTNGYGGCQSNFQLNVGARVRLPATPILQPSPAIRPTIAFRPGTNPCERNNGGCAQICSNQNGMAVCSCPPNWFLNSDRVSCGYDPCGANNGGCEQLCTASGNQAKCDCRVGTLNADRRTCGSQIIVVGTIPPGLVLGCQYFLFDFSTAFNHAGGKSLSFRMSGLSPQTGFSISSNGLLSGTPTAADCASAQPMTITVTATDGVASVQAVMFLSAFCDSSCGSRGQITDGGSPNLPIPSPASSIPLMWAWVCRDFNFDLSRYFVGGQGNVAFSCLGLPQGSGFQMATQGVLQGTPNSVDCARSPLMLTVVARDSAGRESKAVVTIKFSSCGCVQNPSFKGTPTQILPSLPTLPATILPSFPSTPIFPVSQPIFPAPISAPIISYPQVVQPLATTISPTPSLHTHAVAECGQPFFLDSSEYFRVNNLNYQLSGLPPGTGLRLSDSGVLSGTPNSIDARSVNPLLGTIVGTDRTGASVTLVVDIEIKGDCGSLPPPRNQFVTNFRSGFALAPGDSNTGILPVQNAIARQFFRLDLSRVAFSGLRGKLRYEVGGLPTNSGLTMSPAGVLSGIPSDRVCSSAAVPLTVIAIQDAKRTNATLYIKFSCDAPRGVLTTGGSQLPTITGVVGELLYYDCAPYMTTVNSNVSFTIAGLDPASSLRMSSTGVFSGVPSVVDIKGPSLLVTAQDAAGNVIQSTVRLNVVAQASANHPPTFIPLETVHTAGEQAFSVNMLNRFYDQNGDNLTLSVVGLSPQSGIKFNNVTGILSGTPSTYDLSASQPVVFTILADDGHGGRTEGSVYVFFVSGNQKTVAQTVIPSASTRQNRDPISLSIKRQVAIEGVPFLFGVASSFVDQDGDVVTYSMEGLPQKTGLAIDRSSGVIAGTPSRADAEALQPISVTISVTDGQGGSCAQIFLLTVFQGEESSNHEPDARPIPDATIYEGELVLLRLSANFADSDGDALNYSVTGLPTGTGLRLLESSGIFTGTPTAKDQAASPLSLVVHVVDGRGGQAKSLFKLTVKPSASKPKAQQIDNKPREVFKKVTANGIIRIQFEIGQPSFFEASSLFPNHLTYSISGLPVGSGLSMDSKTGVLSGTPTLQDVIGADSLPFRLLPLTISTTDKSGGKMTQDVMLSLFSSSDAVNHAPFARIIPKSQAFPGNEFLLNVWGSFADPDGDSLLFSVIGLPAKSGFQIEPKQGVFFGMPSEADITAPQPLVLTIVADDQRGGRAQENLLLTVSESNARVKSCRQLGWSVFPGSSLCALSPKILDGCPSTITFNDAQKYCSSLGARLCSSQELSDPRFSDNTNDECDVKNKRVWTSSWCADSEVITQASTSDALGAVPKECSAQESRSAMLKCCANSDETGPQALGDPVAASEKTCEQLPSFGTSASSPNKAVCSTSLVRSGVGKGKGANLCSGDVTFDVAKDMCAKRGARLCTADELSQDVGSDQVCGYNSKRVWTSSQCPFEGQVLTQAGASVFLRTVPKQCTKTTATLPVYCCADQKKDQYFQNLNVNATSKEIGLSWNWKVYPNAQVSLRKASGSKGNVVWSTPPAAKNVAMGGDAFVSLPSLEANTRYSIRITPVTADQKPISSQAVEFRASTT